MNNQQLEYNAQMRFTVSSEQIKFFRSDGYLELEQLLTQQEAALLLAAIAAIRVKSPGYAEENLFRSIPLIASLAYKHRWGEIAYALIEKKPLRIEYDKFFTTTPSLAQPLEENGCGLVLDLTSCTGLFFKNHLPTVKSFDGQSYLLLLLTPNHLPEQIHPVIMR